MNVHPLRAGALSVAIAGVLCLTSAYAESAPQSARPAPTGDAHVVVGLGLPSEEHKVSFEGNPEGNSIIKDVKVKPGDAVKAGDVLMTEDTEQAEAQLAVLKAAADTTAAIEETQVQFDAKTKLAAMLKEAGASGREVLDAELDRDVAAARKKQALAEREQKRLEYERQKVKLAHMVLHSPIDGQVQKISLFSGEVVDANKPDGACIIVRNDPLWVELHLPSAQAAKLRKDDKMQVAFPDEPGKWHEGAVIFLDPMVESGSDTQTVRVSMANPDNRPSGLSMTVKLPDKAFAAEADVAGAGNP